MKKLMKFGTMLAVVLSAMVTYAGESDFAMFAKNKEGKTVRVTFNGIKKMALSIYDDSNNLVFEENLSGDTGIKRTYDLDGLPEGTYFLEAESATKIARYKIAVGSSTVAMSNVPVSETYKPVLKNNGGVITLNVPNTKNAPVGVTIYDSNSNEVYNGTLSGQQAADKKFNISQNANDKFTFVLTYGDKTYTETFASR